MFEILTDIETHKVPSVKLELEIEREKYVKKVNEYNAKRTSDL